jgi:hypothetical protein
MASIAVIFIYCFEIRTINLGSFSLQQNPELAILPNRPVLPALSELMPSYSERVPLEQTKHTCPDSSGTTQDFFMLFIDFK